MAERKECPGRCVSSSNVNGDFSNILRTFDVIYIFVSMVAMIADITTDIALAGVYWCGGYVQWSVSTLCCALLPSLVLQIFSIRWHYHDKSLTKCQWVSHALHAGVLHRYAAAVKVCLDTKDATSEKIKKLHTLQADISILHLFQSFLQSAPQTILQMFIILGNQANLMTGVTTAVSVLSLLTAGVAYTLTNLNRKRITATQQNNLNISLLLRCLWHCSTLAARISAILLFAVVFGVWTFVPLGIHWAAMSLWIVSQKTNFCPTKMEELFYNIVMGFIYCFSFLNVREGQTRYRLTTFYSITVSQNLGSLLLFILVSDVDLQSRPWAITASAVIVAGTILGISSMMIYYRWFHGNGPIKWKNEITEDVKNNKDATNLPNNITSNAGSDLHNTRSLKTVWTVESDNIIKKEPSPLENLQQVEVESTDKKLLLEHWIARSGSPTFVSAPIVSNDVFDVSGMEIHTVQGTPDTSVNNIDKSFIDGTLQSDLKKNVNAKRVAVCSPADLRRKISESSEHSEDRFSSNLTLQKRRGICSSDELKDDGKNVSDVKSNSLSTLPKCTDRSSEISQDTDSSNKKTSSDSIYLDLDLSISDINSSDINEFNENIVQKLCLSTLKNIKGGNQDADIQNIQRIALDILKEMYSKKGKYSSDVAEKEAILLRRDMDTPTEAMSVHDYENICAVNIAREAWGLRSWGCYSDIENWQHDDSVFRDRRRDTLTSASSEISSSISSELKNNILLATAGNAKKAHTYSNVFIKSDRSRQDEYIDTIVYELAKCDEETCHGSKIKAVRSDNEPDIFIAKPCVVDQTVIGAPNAIVLEPILEELDEIPDLDVTRKPRHSSESTLVATIDEIRKSTMTNSPRNVYHRTENIWDSPHLNIKDNLDSEPNCSSLKRALWKEPSSLNSSNILDSIEKVKNISTKSPSDHYDLNKLLKCADKAKKIKIGNGTISRQFVSKDSFTNCGRQNSNENIDPAKLHVPKRNTKINNIKTSQGNLKTKSIPKPLPKMFDSEGQLIKACNMETKKMLDVLGTTQISTSLQSLISKDSNSLEVPNIVEARSIAKKSVRNKPRRKFSLLRERFEPKVRDSDEEVLCRSLDSLKSISVHDNQTILKEGDVNNSLSEFDLKIKHGLKSDNFVVMYKDNSADITSSNFNSDGAHIKVKLVKDETCNIDNIKDKRSIFLKQVLSPPKFNTRNKKMQM